MPGDAGLTSGPVELRGQIGGFDIVSELDESTRSSMQPSSTGTQVQ